MKIPEKIKSLIWIIFSYFAEGPFQSDALLVPEGCLFDHIHNASRCWPFIRWNQTGAAACQERGMQMRSFAMLLPCGISLFSGVEFVCCPKHFKGTLKSINISPFIQRKFIISMTVVTHYHNKMLKNDGGNWVTQEPWDARCSMAVEQC